MNFLNSIQSKLHGAVNPNSVQYIKQQDLQVQLDPSGTAYVDHGNQAFSLNVDDENTTALAILDKAPSTQPLSLSGQSQFTICLKHKVQDATNPLIGQYYTNPQYDLSLSSTVLGTLDTVQVNVFNASDDPVSYSITGGLTSADLSNADLTGTVTNLYTPLSYTIRSGYGNFVFGLDGLSQQVTATVYQKYWVKSVTNLLGELVFGFSSTGSAGDYLNQPDISFGAGAKYIFDVSDPTMTDLSLVFGTTVDDISTVNNSVVTRTNDLITLDISAGYDGDRLVYFEDSSSNMGYVASGGGGGDSDAVINLSFDTDGTNSGSYGSSGDITITHDTIDTANAKYGNGALYINSSGETSANYVKSTISTVFSSIPQNWCISLWMKASAWVGTNHNIISALTTEGGLVIGFNTANYLLLFLNGEYVPPAGTNIPSDIDPFDNTYHHYFFKIEGQLLTAYIDGTEITSINFTKSNNVLPGNTLSNFSVGDTRTADNSATMYYDDVRIFDKIVSIDEAKKEIPLTVPYTVDVSNGVFRLDSGSGFVEKPAIDFANNSGTTYIFDQSDSTNAGNTLVIGSFDVSSSIVSSGLTIMGTPGQPGAYTKYVSDGSTVHYFSYQTENMGTASPPPNITDDLYVHYDFEFPLYDPNGTERTDGLTGNNTDVRVYNKAYDSSTNSDISYNGYLAPFGNGGGARLDSTVQKIGSSSVKVYESAVRSDFVWNLDSLQGFSMCIWMKEESASGNLMGAGSPLVFEISYNNSTFTVNISGTTMSYTYTNSDITNITDWNHIAFTMSSDGSTWKLYINGNLVQTKTDGIYFTQTGTINYVDIGAKPGLSTYIGYFDDFRFYKTELDQAKISAVYSYTG